MYLLSGLQLAMFIGGPLLLAGSLALWYMFRAVKAEHQLMLSSLIIEELSNMVFEKQQGTVIRKLKSEDRDEL